MADYMERAKYWRNELEKVGGWQNEMVSVPAGAVRKIIEEFEACAAENECRKCDD